MLFFETLCNIRIFNSVSLRVTVLFVFMHVHKDAHEHVGGAI